MSKPFISAVQIRTILVSAEVNKLCEDAALEIAAKCNARSSWGGYTVKEVSSARRSHWVVINIARHAKEFDRRTRRMLAAVRELTQGGTLEKPR